MQERWDKHSIKAAIYRRGWTLQSLADCHKVDRTTLSATLNRPSPIGERIISKFLNVPANLLWPNRYNADGDRIIQRGGYRGRRTIPKSSQKHSIPFDRGIHE